MGKYKCLFQGEKIMFIEERHQKILEDIKKNGRISTKEIQERFQVSLDSARRDLRILEEKGLLQRTYGGAILTKGNAFYPESDYNPAKIPADEIRENYYKISMKALEFIKPNEVIYLTHGSVGYFMSKNMPRDFNFTAVTNSVLIARELLEYPNISCILTGGEMSPNGYFVDPFALEIMRRLNLDKAFLTAAAISCKNGASIQKISTADFIKCVMEHSTTCIGLFPKEKVGSDSIVSIAPIEAFDIIITDKDADTGELDRMEACGVNIEIVG